MSISDSNSQSTNDLPEGISVPQHVAVIMDGNGRWAKSKGLPRVAGHKRGKDAVRRIVESCVQLGIPYLTLFAFSSENWRRPKSEIRLLLELFLTALDNEVKELHTNGVRFRVVGDVAPFGKRIVASIDAAEKLTANNTRLTLTIAANYGGRWDIARACRKLAEMVTHGLIQPGDISPELIEKHLSTSGTPEPDLFIRTGGEQRVSNFLLWQLAYTEMYFTETAWPDFGRQQMIEAIRSFSSRQRRFGQTSEQVEAKSTTQPVRTGTGPNA